MGKELITNIIFAICLCSIMVILSFLVIHYYWTLKLNHRIKHYTITSKKVEKLSIIDYLISIYLHIVNKISFFFKKHHLFIKYCLRFDKYLIYIKKDHFNSMEFVSSKFLITLLINVLYFIVLCVKTINFNVGHFILINIISFYAMDAIIIILYHSKKKVIEEQLLQAIIIMNGAFKSGKNIYQAVQIIKNELPNPIKEEFDIISKDMEYGLDINIIFERFYERVKVEEARYITSSLSLLNKTGGSVVDVFNMIEKRFYNRLKIRDELKSLTTTSRLLKNTLCVIPFILVLFIFVLDRDFFKPLFSSAIGLIICFVIAVLYILYILVIRQIMKVDEV